MQHTVLGARNSEMSKTLPLTSRGSYGWRRQNVTKWSWENVYVACLLSLEVERKGLEEMKHAWRKAVMAPCRRSHQDWISKKRDEYPGA